MPIVVYQNTAFCAIQLLPTQLTKTLRQNKTRDFPPATNQGKKWPGGQILA